MQGERYNSWALRKPEMKVRGSKVHFQQPRLLLWRMSKSTAGHQTGAVGMWGEHCDGAWWLALAALDRDWRQLNCNANVWRPTTKAEHLAVVMNASSISGTNNKKHISIFCFQTKVLQHPMHLCQRPVYQNENFHIVLMFRAINQHNWDIKDLWRHGPKWFGKSHVQWHTQSKHLVDL